jgi:hypothetical protein
MTRGGASTSTEAISLDLYGLLTIGLVGGGQRDLARMRRQLGPMKIVEDRPADLVVELVDRLPDAGPRVALGREAAYDDHGLIAQRGRRQADVSVRIPIERLGQAPLTIVAERGAPAIPYLIPIVGLTALALGHVPVHASAFIHGGRGILVTGWAKGGKTEALLGFAARGATYVGDEWVFVAADGRTMTGLPEPMRIWDWQLDQSPAIRDRIDRRRRVRLAAAGGTTNLLQRGGRLPFIRDTGVGDAARRLGAIAERQRSLQVPPAEAFGGRVATGPVALDAVILIESTLDGTASLERIRPAALATRIAAMVAHEWLDLGAMLLAHRFAVPDEDVSLAAHQARLEAALHDALAAVPAIWLRHPRPVELQSLAERIEAALAGR